MPVNASPEYAKAEKEYLAAQTLEEKIICLQNMISQAPAHKGGEQLRAQLRSRMKKFREMQEKSKKSKGGGRQGIRKEGAQAVIIGKTLSGKSSLLSMLTQAQPGITHRPFTTQDLEVGTMIYDNTNIQIIENPAIESSYFDSGLVHTADTLILLITNIEELKEIEPRVARATAKKVIVFNKADLLSQDEKRKISANLQSKKYNFSIISAKTGEGIEELKKKIFNSFDILLIFTKEPNKPHSPLPMIMKPGSTVADAAEKIRKGMSSIVKEARIWGPSSKFPNQKVGLSHVLKSKDIIEFHTK